MINTESKFSDSTYLPRTVRSKIPSWQEYGKNLNTNLDLSTESPKLSSQPSKRVKEDVAAEITDGELDWTISTREHEQDVDNDLEYLDLADVEGDEDEDRFLSNRWHQVPNPRLRSPARMLSKHRLSKKRNGFSQLNLMTTPAVAQRNNSTLYSISALTWVGWDWGFERSWYRPLARFTKWHPRRMSRTMFNRIWFHNLGGNAVETRIINKRSRLTNDRKPRPGWVEYRLSITTILPVKSTAGTYINTWARIWFLISHIESIQEDQHSSSNSPFIFLSSLTHCEQSYSAVLWKFFSHHDCKLLLPITSVSEHRC